MADAIVVAAPTPVPTPDERMRAAGIPLDQRERAINVKHITNEDIDWNEKLGRPLNWKENVHPEAETDRRAAWSELHG